MTPEAFTENLMVDVLSRLEPAMRSLAEQVIPVLRPTLVNMVQQRFDRLQSTVGTLEASETYGRVMGMLLRGRLPNVRDDQQGPDPRKFQDFLVLRRRRHPLNAELKQYAVLIHPARPQSMLRIEVSDVAIHSDLIPLKWHESEEAAVLWWLSHYHHTLFWMRDAATWDEGKFYHHYLRQWNENPFMLYVPRQGGTWLRTLKDDIAGGFVVLPSLPEDVSRSLTWIRELLSISTTDTVYNAQALLPEVYDELFQETRTQDVVQAWSRHHQEQHWVQVSENQSPTNVHDSGTVDVPQRGFDTLYSGLGGDRIPDEQVKEGMRVVVDDQHGVVTQVDVHVWRSAPLGFTRDGISTGTPEEHKSYNFKVRLDDERSVNASLVYAEVQRPKFVPPLFMFRGERMPPYKMWQDVLRHQKYLTEWQEKFNRAKRSKKAEMLKQRNTAQVLMRAEVDLLTEFLRQNPTYGPQALAKLPHFFEIADLEKAREFIHGSASSTTQEVAPKPDPDGAKLRAIQGFTPSSFRVPGFGIVAVTAGDDRRHQMWYNISVGRNRFGWDGTRWSRGMRPPSEVLREVRAKGYTMFPEEQSLSDWQPENPAPYEHSSTDESVFDAPIQSGQLACRSVPPMRVEQPCPDHTGPAHTCPCQRAGQQTPHPKRREQSLKTASGALPPDLSDLFPPLQDWGAYD